MPPIKVSKGNKTYNVVLQIYFHTNVTCYTHVTCYNDVSVGVVNHSCEMQ